MSEAKARPSVQDVARLAGVSLGTVSNVLNNPDRVTPSTLAKVTKAIEQLGFVRNDAARQLKAGRSKTIGLVVPDVSNPFFGELSRGAEDTAAAHGYAVILGNSANIQSREAGYLSLFEEQRVGGIVISPLEDVTEAVLRLRERGTPSVLVDRKADPAVACSVSVDDIAGGRMAVEHLISKRSKRVAFVGGPMEFQQVADRYAGAQEAVVAAGGGVSLERIVSADLTVLAGRDVGEEIANRAATDRPDGIFCANDLLAVGIMQAFVFHSRVSIPQDIALVGYDDISFAPAAIVPLTSIRQPEVELGVRAIELLLEEIDGGEHHHQQLTFQPELVVRDSTSR
jgi:LacI family transcriptional regulator